MSEEKLEQPTVNRNRDDDIADVIEDFERKGRSEATQ